MAAGRISSVLAGASGWRAMVVFGLLVLGSMAYLAITLINGAGSDGVVSAHGDRRSLVLKGSRGVHSLSAALLSSAHSSLPPSTVRLVAKALDPQLMSSTLPEGVGFDPGLKNPCWSAAAPGGDDKTGAATLRCLPYAYVIGSFQSGAGTLFAKLAAHPDVITSDVSRWQFWAEDQKGMAEYVDKHSTGAAAAALMAKPGRRVLLDGSASTFAFYWSAGLRAHAAFQRVMVPCWRECGETSRGQAAALRNCTAASCYPRALAADHAVAAGLGVTFDTLHLPLIMHAAYGGGAYVPRLVLLLRHPVDRLACAYWHYAHYHTKYGNSPQGFLDYARTQVAAMRACAERMQGQEGGDGQPMDRAAAERHCALYFEALGPQEEELYFHADQIIRGMYSVFLEVWLRHWPRSSVLVLRAEDYYNDNAKTLDEVISFLGLPRVEDERARAAMLAAGQPSHCLRGASPMLLEARQLLLDFYRPYNEALASLLSDNRWLQFNDPPGTAKDDVQGPRPQ